MGLTDAFNSIEDFESQIIDKSELYKVITELSNDQYNKGMNDGIKIASDSIGNNIKFINDKLREV